MKTFKKDHLPESIEHNGNTYYYNAGITTGWERNNTPLETITKALKLEGRKAVMLICLDKNAKGKPDLHGKTYEGQKYIFTTQAK